MKKLIAVLALTAAMISPAMAATQAEKDEYCTDIKDTAEAIIAARFAGVDVIDVMRIAGNDKIQQAMIRDSYTDYAYKTDEYRKSATKDFGAKYYLDCMKKAK